MKKLQEIFKDHYQELLNLKPRDAIIENVNKMIHCGEPEKGGAMFVCENCGYMKFVPFRCHSRFCPTCGNKYAQDRTLKMSFKIINVQHRHCVFTIDSELRPYFLKDRDLLNCLFEAVNIVMTHLFHKDNKTELYTPGFICVLHTFGRDLKWNPHIHCLVSEGGLSKNNKWKSKTHFNYNYLRNAFRTVLLKLLLEKLGPGFKKVVSKCYREHKDGFYVYAKANKCDPKVVTKYIGRYLGRPVIATSRIDKYDGNYVTFHYNRHEDDKLVSETITAIEFIKRLIRHIPNKNFKQIRYYGIYAKHFTKNVSFNYAISSEKQSFYKSFTNWKNNIYFSFGIDPTKCPRCGKIMTLVDLYVNENHFSLNELYNLTKSNYPLFFKNTS